MGPTSGRHIANKRLQRKLAPFEYSECVNTPRLWKHDTRPILFTLVVEDFGVKYVSKEDVNHLIDSIKLTFSLTKDWMGSLYCGITLEWDYVHRHVDILMPNFIKKKLQEYSHVTPTHIHSCPYHPEPKKYGSGAQAPLPPNATPTMHKRSI